jgi:hypothetical protein
LSNPFFLDFFSFLVSYWMKNSIRYSFFLSVVIKNLYSLLHNTHFFLFSYMFLICSLAFFRVFLVFLLYFFFSYLSVHF